MCDCFSRMLLLQLRLDGIHYTLSAVWSCDLLIAGIFSPLSVLIVAGELRRDA